MIACLSQFMLDNQHLAVWLAAFGTIAAVIVSLGLAFCNRNQLKNLIRALCIPTQISLHRSSAQRLERNGDIFPSCRDASNLWLVPSDSRALRRNLRRLHEIRQEIASLLDQSSDVDPLTPAQQYNLNKNRNIHLLIPHIETLIRCHDELEQSTGIEARDPDGVEQEDGQISSESALSDESSS